MTLEEGHCHFRLLELDEGTTLPSAVDVYDRAVTLSGMSKAYGMAGIRLGWLVTKDADLRTRFQELHDYGSICHVAPAEVGPSHTCPEST